MRCPPPFPHARRSNMGFFKCLPNSGSWSCTDKIDDANTVALPYCPVKQYGWTV